MTNIFTKEEQSTLYLSLIDKSFEVKSLKSFIKHLRDMYIWNCIQIKKAKSFEHPEVDKVKASIHALAVGINKSKEELEKLNSDILNLINKCTFLSEEDFFRECINVMIQAEFDTEQSFINFIKYHTKLVEIARQTLSEVSKHAVIKQDDELARMIERLNNKWIDVENEWNISDTPTE